MFNLSKLLGSLHSLIHFYEEYLLVTRIMSIFALYNVNKHSMLRQKREKNGTGICHVMQGKESKTCPYDSHREQAITGLQDYTPNYVPHWGNAQT